MRKPFAVREQDGQHATTDESCKLRCFFATGRSSAISAWGDAAAPRSAILREAQRVFLGTGALDESSDMLVAEGKSGEIERLKAAQRPMQLSGMILLSLEYWGSLPEQPVMSASDSIGIVGRISCCTWRRALGRASAQGDGPLSLDGCSSLGHVADLSHSINEFFVWHAVNAKLAESSM